MTSPAGAEPPFTAGMPGPDAEITLSHLSIAAQERTIKGSYMGSCIPSARHPALHGDVQGRQAPGRQVLTRTIGFDDLNAAMDRLADAVTVREVLVP